jgi:thiazole synthase
MSMSCCHFKADDLLKIANQLFRSRLIVGTARYPDPMTRTQAIAASEAHIVTLSMRRINYVDKEGGSLLRDLKCENYFLLPNTAGCFTAKEAILTAQLAREALDTTWIKLEVIGDEKTLLPDSTELLKAASELILQGFTVLPYCSDDPIICMKLAALGCAAIMPLASPIGSGMGLNNRYNLALIRKEIPLPVIVDAGIGTASDVALCMEMGMDGVMVNSAIARADDPIHMAHAMHLACVAGRAAYRAGRIPKREYASPSTPLEGMIR